MAALLVWTCMATVVVGQDPAAPSAMDATKALLKRIFHFGDVTPTKAPSPPNDAPVIVMEPVVVTEPYQDREVSGVIDGQSLPPAVSKFNWQDGGAVMQKDLGKTKMQIGAWYSDKAVSFVRLDW